jgi:hypothetical protein
MTVFYITTRPTSGPPYTTSVDVAARRLVGMHLMRSAGGKRGPEFGSATSTVLHRKAGFGRPD